MVAYNSAANFMGEDVAGNRPQAILQGIHSSSLKP